MRLDRQRGAQGTRLITLVPLVDAMLILLIFFMVTSTFLDLDMMPLTEAETPADSIETVTAEGAAAGSSGTVLLRLTADGLVVLRGERLSPPELLGPLRSAIGARTDVPVVVLPSRQAQVQALVTVMATATAAGAGAVRVLRVETAP